ncbi:hypothetical protein GCM10010503_21420 [Streptomyces lucensis JCM 4490]|uniref:Uncharacterized protein n=1 Tax=Streptomyces lucensis JCM 4490 TaxID=1306176 RepID=A0A918J2N5_9ACTN|nr:DUF6153 family protein [Streptomyces lucensis]GGW44328.1 hypothetical protein GCM10010503_21420 [Streptomyces lucensis JCM 4490]
MPSTGPYVSRPPRRHRALLVLAVLAGLLGMHALAPGGGMGHRMGQAEHARSAHMTAAVAAQDDCPGGEGHCGGHHPHHADAACASGAVSGAPQPPALLPDHGTVLAPAHRVRSLRATAPEGARAPPSLAELQLLRI